MDKAWIFLFNQMDLRGWFALGIMNIPVYLFIGSLFWKSWDEVVEYWFCNLLVHPEDLEASRASSFTFFSYLAVITFIVLVEGATIAKYSPQFLPFLNRFPWFM